jgi:hypothetical protein
MVTNILLLCERHGKRLPLKGVSIQGVNPQQVKEPWRGISWSLRSSWAGQLYFETRDPSPGPGLDEIFDDISMYLLSTSQCTNVFRIE